MKVRVDTIVRTIMLFVALTNQILTSTGKNPLPFSDELIYQLVTLIITVIVSLWTYWKNNSWSDAAITADTLLAVLKSGEFEDKETPEG